MQSAFGVEHGDEIAKFGMPGSLLKPVKSLGSAMGSGTTKVGQKVKPLSANTKMGVRNIGKPGGTAGTARGAGTRGAVGGARQSAGGAMRRAGNWMSANPTATGGAALGIGAGAAGGAALSNRRRY